MLTFKVAYILMVVLGTSLLFAVSLGLVLGTAMAAYNWPAHESNIEPQREFRGPSLPSPAFTRQG